jgi:hypothetical protein
MTTRQYSSRSQQSTLTGTITSGATSFTVVSGSALLGGVTIPAGRTFTLVIDPDTALEEIVDATAVSTNTFTVTRAIDGASAQDHSAGAVVRHMAIGRDFRDANLHTQASASYNDGSGNAQSMHGILSGEGDVVGTLKTQTLTNKTLTSPTISNPTFTGTPQAGASIVFEGDTVDAFETTLTVVDPTQDNTVTIPNTSGTVTINDATQTLTNKTLTSPTISGSPVITGLSSAGMVSSSAAPKDYVDSILGSAVAASTSAASAATSAIAASTSAASASTSAIAASTSAVQASTSAASASVSAIAASTSQIAASTSAASASVSATSADASVSAVQASAVAAQTSAASASVSQIAASTSAANALVSANSAAAAVTLASTSAAAAAASAVAASTSAVNASTSAVNASTSAASANVSAIAASTSAASASISASSATAAVASIEGFSIAAQTSAASAAASAVAASTSEVNASTSAASASVSAIAASTSATLAEASYDSFDDRYLGAKSSPPTVDNDGDPLLTGALYWNTVANQMFVWSGSAWGEISSTAQIFRYKYTAAGGETSESGPDDNSLTLSYIPGKEQVYLNGVLLVRGTDYVASNGTSIASLSPALAASDILEIITFTAFDVATALGTDLFEAKGDLLSASAAGTPSRLALGTNGYYLSVNTSTASGLEWAEVPEPDLDSITISTLMGVLL